MHENAITQPIVFRPKDQHFGRGLGTNAVAWEESKYMKITDHPGSGSSFWQFVFFEIQADETLANSHSDVSIV